MSFTAYTGPHSPLSVRGGRVDEFARLWIVDLFWEKINDSQPRYLMEHQVMPAFPRKETAFSPYIRRCDSKHE